MKVQWSGNKDELRLLNEQEKLLKETEEKIKSLDSETNGVSRVPCVSCDLCPLPLSSWLDVGFWIELISRGSKRSREVLGGVQGGVSESE
jgi:hypothetical protein